MLEEISEFSLDSQFSLSYMRSSHQIDEDLLFYILFIIIFDFTDKCNIYEIKHGVLVNKCMV